MMWQLRLMWYFILGTVCLAIVAVVTTLGFWITDRKSPVEVMWREVVPLDPIPGGRVLVRMRVKYLRDCGAHADRVLFDGHSNRQFLPDFDYERPPEGLGEFTVQFVVPIPDTFKPGKARYLSTPAFFCNPIHRHYWPIPGDAITLYFTIE